MNWLVLVAIAVFTDSLRIFIDNYTSDVYFKGKLAASQKLFYGYTTAIIGLAIICFTGFTVFQLPPSIIIMFFLAGALSAISGIPYYKACEVDESTNLGIFTQLSPVLYLIISWVFLDEAFSPMQLVAFAIVLSAPALIVFSSRKRSRKMRIRAMIYAFLYVVIAVVGNVLFVKASQETDISFVEQIGITMLMKGITALIICYSIPKWRKRFRAVVKQSKRKVFRPMFINVLITLIKDFSYRGALVVAPAVAIASAASDSIEPIVIFFMGILLTLIWPKFGREHLDRKTVRVHLIATVLVVVGVVLLQM